MKCCQKNFFFKRYFGNKILQFICFAFFHTNLSYVCANWGQYNFVSLHKLSIAGRNALEITCFTKFDYHTAQLFHELKIIKFTERHNHQTRLNYSIKLKL